MTDNDHPIIGGNRMCVANRAANGAQLRLLELCRRFDGRMVYREGDRILLAFGAVREALDAAL